MAFWNLSTCRPIGMSEGMIPWTAVRVYADTYDVHGHEFERLLFLVRAMDMEYLKHREKQSKRK